MISAVLGVKNVPLRQSLRPRRSSRARRVGLEDKAAGTRVHDLAEYFLGVVDRQHEDLGSRSAGRNLTHGLRSSTTAMLMSIKVTSGSLPRTPSIAALPSAASPTIVGRAPSFWP